MNTSTKARMNLALLLLAALVYAASALALIDGFSHQAVSNEYLTLLTPSRFALYIWGLIGLLLALSLSLMLARSSRPAMVRLIDAFTPPFVLSVLFHHAWIITFSFRLLGLATAFMLANTICLAILNIRLKTGLSLPRRVSALGFGLYNGWAIFATIATAAAALQQAAWGRFGLSEKTWALIVLGAFLLIVLAIETRVHNAALPLGAAWACFGIMLRHNGIGVFQRQYPAVEAAAALCAVGYLVYAGGIFVLNKRCVIPRIDQKPAAPLPEEEAQAEASL